MQSVVIYLIIGAALIGFILLFKIGEFSLNRKKIGKLVYSFDRESQNVNTNMLVLRVVVGLGILVLYIFIRGTQFSWLAVAFVAVMSAMLGTFIYPLLTLNTGYGIYENGVVTQYGIALYENCSGFYLERNERRRVHLLMMLNKIPLLNNYMLIVPPAQVAKVKNILLHKLPQVKQTGIFARNK